MIKHGEAYKYAIHSNTGEYLEKSDPFAAYFETPPKTASILWEPKYEWKDQAWLEERKQVAGKPKPYSVYEVHFGSWKKQMKKATAR
jgi:1,4-alpha-glucan branching enzyme